MKVSIISTVFNEEKNIRNFLDSMMNQTRNPDEVIIVDGGSKDKTYEILKEYSKKYKFIKVYQKKGFNISQGRNYAIEKSKGGIIFTSDSSTRFERDWIKKILNGFHKEVDVVFGRWRIEPHNIIERFLISRMPNWENINPDRFIPSNRHVAFRRDVWKKVGGYPEHLKRADDNWFHLRAHKLGFKYKFVKEAEVIWLLERNLRTMIRLAFEDSKTEGFSLMFIKRPIYTLEMLVLILSLGILFLGIVYDSRILSYFIGIGVIASIFLGGIKTAVKARSLSLIFVGPFLFVFLYFSHVFGVLMGIIQRMYKKTED